MCPTPATLPLNLTGWFAKPKPSPLPPPKTPSGKRLNVLHLSDFHLDPSELNHYIFGCLVSLGSIFPIGYATGAEANCTSGLCCRSNNFNKNSLNKTISPAPRFGAFLWCVGSRFITPYALVLIKIKWHALCPSSGSPWIHSYSDKYSEHWFCLDGIYRWFGFSWSR